MTSAILLFLYSFKIIDSSDNKILRDLLNLLRTYFVILANTKIENAQKQICTKPNTFCSLNCKIIRIQSISIFSRLIFTLQSVSNKISKFKRNQIYKSCKANIIMIPIERNRIEITITWTK